MECGQEALREHIGRRVAAEESYHRHRRLLCARRERPPGCRAAEQRDERAPLYVDARHSRHHGRTCSGHPRLCRLTEERRGCPVREGARRILPAPPHSITSSARPSNGSGTVTPSVLAVLRLIINSTLVACCTGSSAGFSPLRIRPV